VTGNLPIDVLWEEMYWEADASEPAPARTLEVVRDDFSLVERFLQDLKADEFPYLAFISRETVTIFHQRHLAQLVDELEVLSERNHEAQVADQLRAVLKLVSAAQGPEDTMIVFRIRQSRDAQLNH